MTILVTQLDPDRVRVRVHNHVIDTTPDVAHELEVELRRARLDALGMQAHCITADEVEQYDVIASLGMTVTDVLSGSQGETILQGHDMEVLLPSGQLIEINRRVQ